MHQAALQERKYDTKEQLKSFLSLFQIFMHDKKKFNINHNLNFTQYL